MCGYVWVFKYQVYHWSWYLSKKASCYCNLEYVYVGSSLVKMSASKGVLNVEVAIQGIWMCLFGTTPVVRHDGDAFAMLFTKTYRSSISLKGCAFWGQTQFNCIICPLQWWQCSLEQTETEKSNYLFRAQGGVERNDSLNEAKAWNRMASRQSSPS